MTCGAAGFLKFGPTTQPDMSSKANVAIRGRTGDLRARMQRLEPPILVRFAARLKSCPDTNRLLEKALANVISKISKLVVHVGSVEF